MNPQDESRKTRLRRLGEALEGMAPEQVERAVTVAAKLLVIKARKRRALQFATQAAAASMVPVGTQLELFAPAELASPIAVASVLQRPLPGV